jgi:uncharacterized small protein (DUF1192 family)
MAFCFPKRRPALLLALSLAAVAAGCGRGSPVSVTPPPVPSVSPAFLEAERAMGEGAYSRADTLYGEIVEGGLPERETALARRALIYALPGTGMHDRVRAETYAEQLRTEYPSTILLTEIEAVLGILPAFDDLEQSAGERLDRIDALESSLADSRRERELLSTFLSHAFPRDAQFDPDLARDDYLRLLEAFPGSASVRASERVLFLLSQWERLSSTGDELAENVGELTARVAALQQELDRLKEIDLGRQVPNSRP